jgi:transposase
VGRAPLAARQKKVREEAATLGFTDESGFLLAPLTRRTLAPRGHTPVLRQRARHRDKVSVAAALTLSPRRGHCSLYYQTFPDLYVDAELYAWFLRRLLGRVAGPLVLVHDGGSMHKGPPLRDLAADFPRLEVVPLPPYAPELNPNEPMWEHTKCEDLANFVPLDVPQLDGAVCHCLDGYRCDQTRLRSFFAATALPWDGLTVFF